MDCARSLIILTFAGMLVSVQSQTPSPCKDPSALQECLRNLAAYEQSVKLISDKEQLEADCRLFNESMSCLDNYMTVCFSDSQRTDFDNRMSNVRKAVAKLCSDQKLKEDLIYHQDCYEKVTDSWNECSQTFLHQSTNKDNSLCNVRNSFIKCSYDAAMNKCSEGSAKSVCKMGTTLISMTIPSNACSTDGAEYCSAGYGLQPTFMFLLIAALLGIRNMFKEV